VRIDHFPYIKISNDYLNGVVGVNASPVWLMKILIKAIASALEHNTDITSE
jgi:hypothetical protein